MSHVWKAAAAASFLVLAGTGGAFGHHAKSGWQYPGGCCDAIDCVELKLGDVEWTTNGWLIKKTQEVIAFENTQGESGDGHFHRCLVQPLYDRSRTREHISNKRKCLYIPAPEQ